MEARERWCNASHLCRSQQPMQNCWVPNDLSYLHIQTVYGYVIQFREKKRCNSDTTEHHDAREQKVNKKQKKQMRLWHPKSCNKSIPSIHPHGQAESTAQKHSSEQVYERSVYRFYLLVLMSKILITKLRRMVNDHLYLYPVSYCSSYIYCGTTFPNISFN